MRAHYPRSHGLKRLHRVYRAPAARYAPRIRVDNTMRHTTRLILTCLLLALNTPHAWAQSSVRPPGQPMTDNAPASTAAATPIPVPNPNTQLWNAVRGRIDAPTVSTQIRGVDTDKLIHQGGEQWRHWRMTELIPKAGMLLAAILGLIVLFRLVRGKIKIQAGRSGNTIQRFTRRQRYVHWSTATLFITLGLTGMTLLFGRHVLLPWMGPEWFGGLALIAKRIHDIAGPLFTLSLLLMMLSFIKGNIPNGSDIQWLRKGGGLLGKHASAGRYNLGEKAWYWWAMAGGAVLIVSGMVLLFPNFGQPRETMALYHMLHGIAAAAVLAFAFGHIYMGTLAMEGAFEAMATGRCDVNWAKEHHDLWYQQTVAQPHESTPAHHGADTPSNTASG